MFNSQFGFCSYCRPEDPGGGSISVESAKEGSSISVESATDDEDDDEDDDDSILEAARNELGQPKKKSA